MTSFSSIVRLFVVFPSNLHIFDEQNELEKAKKQSRMRYMHLIGLSLIYSWIYDLQKRNLCLGALKTYNPFSTAIMKIENGRRAVRVSFWLIISTAGVHDYETS